jgi:ABC-type multidrug transport system ATPase subunit
LAADRFRFAIVGKSTQAKLVAGAITPTAGAVRIDGCDLHAEYASLRHRIGMVPQDDVVHHQLTLGRIILHCRKFQRAR